MVVKSQRLDVANVCLIVGIDPMGFLFRTHKKEDTSAHVRENEISYILYRLEPDLPARCVDSRASALCMTVEQGQIPSLWTKKKHSCRNTFFRLLCVVARTSLISYKTFPMLSAVHETHRNLRAAALRCIRDVSALQVGALFQPVISRHLRICQYFPGKKLYLTIELCASRVTSAGVCLLHSMFRASSLDLP